MMTSSLVSTVPTPASSAACSLLICVVLIVGLPQRKVGPRSQRASGTTWCGALLVALAPGRGDVVGAGVGDLLAEVLVDVTLEDHEHRARGHVVAEEAHLLVQLGL